MGNFFNKFGMQLFADRYATYDGETPEDALMRIATHVANNEDERHEFYEIMRHKQFVPGGRIWRSAGNGLTGNNCFMLPRPHDSMKGIIATLDNMTELMRHGGGVGINISSLRPSGSVVRGVDGTSSGAVELAELYSYATGMIRQGGSRRGALMLSMHVWHPDILAFITAKKDMSRFTNANLSVMLSDDFMQAVLEDDNWFFYFPRTDHEAYDTEWDGDLDRWTAKHGGTSLDTYGPVSARLIWDAIIDAAWTSAEPGVLFWTTAQRDSNSEYYSPIVGVNPCAEQALPAYGVCNLGHINLAEFVITGGDAQTAGYPVVDWDTLQHVVRNGVRFLDNVIDKTNHVLPEAAVQQRQERRIGLGVFGYHDLLILLGLEYGTLEALQFTEQLFCYIRDEAYQASIDLAAEKGSYHAYSFPSAIEGTFLGWLHDNDAVSNLRQHGIRNSTILTIAPTGTVATMYDRSTGIEPHFAFAYTRTWDGGVQEVVPQIVEETRDKRLLVSAHDIIPARHVDTIITVQQHVDSSISKTVNLPASATRDDVADAYWQAWTGEAKGCTVYRDGCRNEQVLHTATCAECGADMVNQDGCMTCKECGNALCSI